MICPSCNFPSDGDSKFCIRCGFALAKHGPLMAQLRRSSAWILRRSLAGLSTGAIAWFIIPITARAAANVFGQTGHLVLSGLIGGYFLGLVEGMVEDSTIKTIRGGLLGALGGALGGAIGSAVLSSSGSASWAIVLSWGITGATVGVSSVWLERKVSRIGIGLAAGFLGGALGGWLGYQMYYGLVETLKPETWLLKRCLEASTGIVVGAVLWFVMGSAEKFLIFRRRVVTNISYKECDRCAHINLLKAWYCAGCGNLLQVAAPAEKMQWTKREALVRVIAACQFGGQLSIMTGVAVACLAMGLLALLNVFLSIFGFLGSAILAYLASTAFYAVSDYLSLKLEAPEVTVRQKSPTVQA